MNQVLSVWSEGRKLGTVSSTQGRWCFAYDACWLKLDARFPLSPYFPFQAEPFVDSSDNKQVEWYFENLLPEGGMREAMARHARLHEQDSFGLLRRYGEDCAGALTLLPVGSEYPERSHYSLISHENLRQRIARSSTTPLLTSSDALHMSLAGVQNKLAVLFRDNRFYLPEYSAASSHILKPEHADPLFPCCPANEFFCMRLAKVMGLPVPDVRLLHLPESVYLVSRFDRSADLDSGIRRHHQIDLCQLLNKWVGYKYESHGGVGFADLFQALDQLRQPAVARGLVVRWIIFNYLIGNSDAHAKNISFLFNERGFAMAPFYDLLCVQAYLPESVMSMSMGDENRPGWIESAHWQELATLAGIPFYLMKSYLQRQSKAIETEATRLTALPEFNREEQVFLRREVVAVIHQRIDMMARAM